MVSGVPLRHDVLRNLAPRRNAAVLRGRTQPIHAANLEPRTTATPGRAERRPDDAEFEEEPIQLATNHLLVVFSDGISTATNERDEEFGDNGIIKSVRVPPDERDPDAVLTRLFDRVHAFTANELQGNDMTALVLRYRGPTK